MSQAFILLGSVPSAPGKLLPIDIEVDIHKDTARDNVVCSGFPPQMVTVAENAFKLAKWELMRIHAIRKELANAGLQVLLVNNSSSTHFAEGVSAGFAFALMIGAAVYRAVTGHQLHYSFAATGRLSNARKVKSVGLLNQKLSAAINGLNAGDKILYPAENSSSALDELARQAKKQGISLIPVQTLQDGFEEFWGQVFKPNNVKRFPFALVATVVLILSFFITSAFLLKKNMVQFPTNSPPLVRSVSSDSLGGVTQAQTVSLTLGSDLPTAIFFDGAIKAADTRGPIHFNVSADSHTVTFSHSQFAPVSFAIFAEPGKRSEFTCKYLTSVKINSTLESGRFQNALVKINDEFWENTYTPATIQLKPGSYKVSVSKDGFEPVAGDSIHLLPKLNENEKELTFELKRSDKRGG